MAQCAAPHHTTPPATALARGSRGRARIPLRSAPAHPGSGAVAGGAQPGARDWPPSIRLAEVEPSAAQHPAASLLVGAGLATCAVSLRTACGPCGRCCPGLGACTGWPDAHGRPPLSAPGRWPQHCLPPPPPAAHTTCCLDSAHAPCAPKIKRCQVPPVTRHASSRLIECHVDRSPHASRPPRGTGRTQDMLAACDGRVMCLLSVFSAPVCPGRTAWLVPPRCLHRGLGVRLRQADPVILAAAPARARFARASWHPVPWFHETRRPLLDLGLDRLGTSMPPPRRVPRG